MSSRAPGRPVVWVVEDSPLDAQRACDALGASFEVCVFGDGATMLEALAAATPPDVLVLDWVLPGASGLDIARFLRAQPAPQNQIDIVFLTASRTPEQVVQSLEAGANDFVAKPFHPAELKARVDALVRTRSLIRNLASSEALVRELLSKSPDALLGLDGRGRVVYVNDAAAALFHADAAALVGRPGQELLPDLVGLTDRAVGQTPSSLPDVTIENRVFAPTIRRSNGGEVAFMASLRDVTDSRKDEERRLDFYSTVAHDLRSPLSAVLLRCALIQKGKHGLLPAGLVADFHKIEGHLRSLVALINDFLDLAKLESAGLKLKRDPVPLPDVVDRVLDELLPLAQAGGLELRFAPPRGDLVVPGDQGRLAQVLSNLLSNAIKFTGAGGTIDVVAEPRGDVAYVAVVDNGQGIAEEEIPTLFDRFTQATRSRSSVGGTGLGLMIVKQIVEAHGGRVGVSSVVGKGSTFWVELPRAEGQAHE